MEGAFLKRAVQGPKPCSEETPDDTHPVEINDTTDCVVDLRNQERNVYHTRHDLPRELLV